MKKTLLTVFALCAAISLWAQELVTDSIATDNIIADSIAADSITPDSIEADTLAMDVQSLELVPLQVADSIEEDSIAPVVPYYLLWNDSSLTDIEMRTLDWSLRGGARHHHPARFGI